MKAVRFLCISLAVFLSAGVLSSCTSAKTGGGMRGMTTMELVYDMGIGINLGNTLEACGDWIRGRVVRDFETAWGSPIITEELIKGYADAGFGVVRIPVAWSNLMEDDYTIHPALMNRVEQITQWVLQHGMYAIVNIHWDGGWWSDFPFDYDKCMHKYITIWEQIAERFKNYGDKLMFESANEELGWDSLWNRWSGSDNGKARSYEILNDVNQAFVDLVRASGGNNAKRHLLIAGYHTDIALTCDPYFVMPQDPENRCAVSVHYYTPPTFAILDKDASWGRVRTSWGTENDYRELERYMDMVKTTFIDNGIPVILGEFGSATRGKEEGSVLRYITAVCEAAFIRGICPVLWDITDVFYCRTTFTMKDAEMEARFREIAQMER